MQVISRRAEPTRVLHVIDSLQPGGAEQALSLLVRHHDPDRYRATVYGLRGLGPLADGLAARGLMANATVPGDVPRQLLAFRRHLAAAKPTIVHTHLNASDFLAGPLARTAGVPLLLSYKASILRKHSERQGLHNAVARVAARCDDAVVVLSHALESYLAAHHIVPASKLRVVHYGVELTAGAAAPASRELFGPGGGPTILLPARLEPRKDHQTFLRAFALLQRDLPDVRAAFAGDGAPEFRSQLEAAASALGVRVAFLGKRMDVPALMRASDLVVLSSLTEGLGLVLLEAMAERRAVVATAVGGVPEIVIDGETGVLVPPADSVALASAMHRLLSDAGLRGRMGEAGRKRVEAEFTVARMAQKVEAVYDELLTARRA